ncbi:hypothetical protein B0H34DRAFT_709019 [Crassisporium funariophilum]|nr:hypothetical protein B0H34DRAFT_709019 [Crassisporium funariophilum]
MTLTALASRRPKLPRRSKLERLPQELSNQIIHYLQCDNMSLKNCSLVCSAWLYETRPHMFQTVTFTSQSLSPLLSLIHDPRSTITPVIRRIEIIGVEWQHAHNASRFRIIAAFQSTLTHLHLVGTVFHVFPDVVDFICSFSCLVILALDAVKWRTSRSGDITTSVQESIFPVSIKHLRLHDMPLRAFMFWLTEHVVALTHLDVGPIEEHDAIQTAKYLCQRGPGLKHLTFSFAHIENGRIGAYHDPAEPGPMHKRSEGSHHILSLSDYYQAVFGIETCPTVKFLTGLSSVRVNNFVYNGDRTRSGAMFWGPKALASITAAELKKVVLEVTLRSVGELDRLNIRWEFLDEIFASELYFPQLNSLLFEIHGKVNTEGFGGLISARLPRCMKRGIIQFYRPSWALFDTY